MSDQRDDRGHATADLPALNGALAMVAFSPGGTILRANDRFLDLFGYDINEIIGRKANLFGSPTDAWEDHRGLGAALGRGEARGCQGLCHRKDGSDVWIQATYVPVTDAAGTVVEIVQMTVELSPEVLRHADDHGQVAAIERSHAVAHFDLDGTIRHANDLFLNIMGYRADEVLGRHHDMFVARADAASAEHAAFWGRLTAGEHQRSDYRRIAKGGRTIWLQATYSPILDRTGRPVRIVQCATDATREKARQADARSQVTAIHKSQCVITFDLYGTILDANDLFLDAMGYRLDEIQGRHHRMFVDRSYAHGLDYALFWRELGRGRHQSGQFSRVARDGREVWLQATYNPVFDHDGRPIKVVKYATVVTDQKLGQAELQGQIAAIHKAQCVISFDLDGTIIDANDNFLDAMNYRHAEVRGRHHRMFVTQDESSSPEYAAFWADLAAGRHHAGEYKRIGSDGREVWLQASYNPIFDLKGRPFRVVKYATDVTQDRLRQADHEGQIAAIHKSQGVIAFDMDGVIIDANDNAQAMFGYRLDELRGHHHQMLVEPRFAETRDHADLWDALRAGTFQKGIYRRVGKQGRNIWIQASYNPILDLNGRAFKVVKFATDITSEIALAEAYDDAKRQAQHDPGTALPNRVRLASFMSSALALPGARLVVLYLDLDRFKPINDTFGHNAGDRVLGEIADRLRRSLRNDQIAARVGGDEFVVACPNLPDGEIEALCQRLIDVANAPIHYEDQELTVGLSIGIAVAPGDATTPDDLLRCADLALYRSKRNSGGTYNFFASEVNDRLNLFRDLADEMRRGLAANEFYLDYQPRFNARQRSVRSVEALVRWAHPERGRINPADFIPLAERNGVIVPLGEWVLRTACQAVTQWPEIGVSVNVSPMQFRDGDLVETVSRALADAGLDPRRLEIEITEGVLLEDAERAHLALKGLKALGVRLAMDDFGTGYSSLSNLRRFPFDVIKIDRRFIADMEVGEEGRIVVQAIIGLANALRLSVTAEGVETVGQLAMLTFDQCAEVQGYLLGRPMSAAKIDELLAQYRPLEHIGAAEPHRVLPVSPARDGIVDLGARIEASARQVQIGRPRTTTP